MPTKEEIARFLYLVDRMCKRDGSLSISHPHLSAFSEKERDQFPDEAFIKVKNWLKGLHQ